MQTCEHITLVQLSVLNLPIVVSVFFVLGLVLQISTCLYTLFIVSWI